MYSFPRIAFSLSAWIHVANDCEVLPPTLINALSDLKATTYFDSLKYALDLRVSGLNDVLSPPGGHERVKFTSRLTLHTVLLLLLCKRYNEVFRINYKDR